jgi:hypothetical protein
MFGGFGGFASTQQLNTGPAGAGFFLPSQSDVGRSSFVKPRGFLNTTVNDILRDKVNAETVELLGLIQSIKRDDSLIRFQLKDYSNDSAIDCTKYVEFPGASSDIVEGKLYKVIGAVRSFSNEFSLTCHRVIAIDAADELSRHLTAVVFAWVQNEMKEKGARLSSGGQPAIAAPVAPAPLPAPDHSGTAQNLQEIDLESFLDTLKAKYSSSGFTMEQARSLVSPGQDLDKAIRELMEMNYLFNDWSEKGIIKFC